MLCDGGEPAGGKADMGADSYERTHGLTRFRAVTPGTADLKLGLIYPRAIQVAASGTVIGTGVDDSVDVTHYYVAGVWHPAVFKSISGGTATGIVAGY